jgi:isoamylase
MLCGGDEIGRTQKGNNNVYCQDNEISWQPWTRTAEQEKLFEFTSKLIALRNQHPIFHRPKFFKGKPIIGNLKDINWVCPDGREMTEGDWNNQLTRSLGIILCGDDMGAKTFEGHAIRDDTFFLCFNAHHEKVAFTVPGQPGVDWQMLLDTDLSEGFLKEGTTHASESELSLQGRSFCLLKQIVGSDEEAKAGSRAKKESAAAPPLPKAAPGPGQKTEVKFTPGPAAVLGGK